MSGNARTTRWGHHALNLALLALGVALMALLYALVSQYLGDGGRQEASLAPSRPEAAVAGGAPAGEIIQVGVRNGCGVGGLAAEARNHLVRAGFDVVEVGNYATFDVDSSMVLDRVGNLAAARRVARAMGIPEARVRQEKGAQYYLDATVVIGADYRSLDPFQGKKQARPAEATP